MLDLARFPRVALCHRPTPLEPMLHLSEHLGGANILIKRDDCTGLATGGNKTGSWNSWSARRSPGTLTFW